MNRTDKPSDRNYLTLIFVDIVDPIPMPKRPSTAWGLFFVEHLDKVRASGKPVVPTAETVVAAAQWKVLPESQKQVLHRTHDRSNFAFSICQCRAKK